MKPGDQVAGYRIESMLGRGGMGIVYEATQLSLKRPIALKILYPHLSQDPVFRARFRREGELQAAIDHPHIVTVYEAGEADEGLFLAMRLIRGSTLKDLIVAGELGGEDAVRLLLPIAEALDSAHAAGMTHRDIKPQNILVGPRGHAYLADFGLTRSAADTALTKTGQFVGTLDYVSPEQIRGEEASPASDIYALTAVLYECLCGVVPFPKPSDVAVLNAHVSDPPPLVTEHRPELAPAVDEVIARGMAKDASERQTSATEMIVEADRAISTPAHGTLALDSEPETVVREAPPQPAPEPDESAIATPLPATPSEPAATPPPATPSEPAATAPPATPSEPAATPPPATPSEPAATPPPATPSEPAATPPPATPSEPAARPAGRKRVAAIAAGALLVLALIVGALTLGGDSDPPASATTTEAESTERQGNQITMRSVPGTTAVANAGLIDYGEPPPTIRIDLTPGGPRYQLLLFQTLDSVRSAEAIPTTAMLVLGGGRLGDLSTGEDEETGYTRKYGITMPANLRRFRYFGIVRVDGAKRTLVLYDRVDRLEDPK